jgi:hypothetical protein
LVAATSATITIISISPASRLTSRPYAYPTVSSEISDRVQTVADRLAKLGATVSDTARPAIDLDASNQIYL